MADRYWVGGTAAWDNTAGTKWATTSGGAGGAAVPTSADDVYFDANSGSGTITIQGGNCRNLTTTGFIGTLTGTSSFQLYVYGNLTLAASHTYSAQTLVYMPGTGANRTLSSAGHALYRLSVYGAGTVTLTGDLTAGSLTVSNGATFDANTYNVAVQSGVDAYGSPSAQPVVKLSTGTWTLSGTGTVWWMYAEAIVDAPAGSKILLTNTGTGTKEFRSYGHSYSGTLEIQGSSVCTYVVLGSPALGTLKYSKTVASTFSFGSGSTISIAQWLVSGTSGNLVTLTGSTTTLTYTGIGKVSADYLNISNITATPSNTWYAGTHSVDSGGNTGWTFSDPPVASSIGFFACSF